MESTELAKYDHTVSKVNHYLSAVCIQKTSCTLTLDDEKGYQKSYRGKWIWKQLLNSNKGHLCWRNCR